MAGTEEDGQSIPGFFSGKNVLITGVTGFLGKVLLEKLLRSCPDVGLVYLLVRPKKGLQPQDRVSKILDSQLYDKVKAAQPWIVGKVVPVCGNILEPDFGMSCEDLQRVCDTTSVVFHCAATVRFDEDLNLAVKMNVGSVLHLTSLCRKMPMLEALVHVSTAYANCYRNDVAERVYDPPLPPRKLVDMVQWMDEEIVDSLTSKLIGDWPNTYTFTKALAESLIAEEAKDLPVAIFRPSIVTASWEEPMPGWLDSYNGASGLLVSVGKGLFRRIRGDNNVIADLIPVDFTGNAMIAIAWYTAVKTPTKLMVYNCTTGHHGGFTWGCLGQMAPEFFTKTPFDVKFRSPALNFYRRELLYRLFHTFDQLLPAYLMDLRLKLTGKSAVFVKIEGKLQETSRSLEFFTSHGWNFSYNNLPLLQNKMSDEDRKMFLFDPSIIDWRVYMERYCLGIKQFLLKEKTSNKTGSRMRRETLCTVLKVVGVAVGCRYLMCHVPVLQAMWNACVGKMPCVFFKLPLMEKFV